MKNYYKLNTAKIHIPKPYRLPKGVPEYLCETCHNCHNGYYIKHKRPVDSKFNKCFYHNFYKGALCPYCFYLNKADNYAIKQ